MYYIWMVLKGLRGMYTIYIGIKEESNHLPHFNNHIV